MPHGALFYTEDGHIQFDAVNSTMKMGASGTGTVQTDPNTGNNYVSIQYPSFANNASAPWMFVRPQQVPATLRNGSINVVHDNQYNSGQSTVRGTAYYLTTLPAGAKVDYFLFDRIHYGSALPTTNCGVEIFDSAGRLCFSGIQQPLKIVGFHANFTPTTNPAWTYSVVTTKKVAIATYGAQTLWYYQLVSGTIYNAYQYTLATEINATGYTVYWKEISYTPNVDMAAVGTPVSHTGSTADGYKVVVADVTDYSITTQNQGQTVSVTLSPTAQNMGGYQTSLFGNEMTATVLNGTASAYNWHITHVSGTGGSPTWSIAEGQGTATCVPRVDFPGGGVYTADIRCTVTVSGQQYTSTPVRLQYYYNTTSAYPLSPGNQSTTDTNGYKTFSAETITGAGTSSFTWSFVGETGGTWSINSGQGTNSVVPAVSGIASGGTASATLRVHYYKPDGSAEQLTRYCTLQHTHQVGTVSVTMSNSGNETITSSTSSTTFPTRTITVTNGTASSYTWSLISQSGTGTWTITSGGTGTNNAAVTVSGVPAGQSSSITLRCVTVVNGSSYTNSVVLTKSQTGSGGALTVSLSTSSVYGYCDTGLNSCAAVTDNVTAFASGGTGTGRTYLWEYVSGVTASMGSSTSATTYFSRSKTVGSYIGYYRCKVTDSGGNVGYSPNVQVVTDHDPAGGGGGGGGVEP